MEINTEKCMGLNTKEYFSLRSEAKELLLEIVGYAKRAQKSNLTGGETAMLLKGGNATLDSIPFKRFTALVELERNGFIKLDL